MDSLVVGEAGLVNGPVWIVSKHPIPKTSVSMTP